MKQNLPNVNFCLKLKRSVALTMLVESGGCVFVLNFVFCQLLPMPSSDMTSDPKQLCPAILPHSGSNKYTHELRTKGLYAVCLTIRYCHLRQKP